MDSPHKSTASKLRRIPLLLLLAGILTSMGILQFARAATDTWTGATSTDWNGTNWTGGNSIPFNGDALAFGSVNGQGTNTLTDTLASTVKFNGITFNSGALAYTMTGNAIQLNSGEFITNNSANLETFNNAVSVLGGESFTMTSGGGNITVNGALTGAAGSNNIVIAGVGTLTLTNNDGGFFGIYTIGASTNLLLSGTGQLNGGATPGSITDNGTFTFNSSVSQTYNGVISGAAGQLTVNSGALTLGGAETYTGATTVNGGTLTLTNTLASTVLAMGGGTFNESRTGSGLDLSISTTYINAGASVINETASGTYIKLGNLSRGVGGTVDFAGGAGAIQTTTANTNGILGGWATYGGGANWAVGAATNGVSTTIVLYTGYTAYNTASSTFAPGSTANVDFQIGNTTAALTQTINSLRFNTAGTDTLTLGTSQILTIASGGILVTPTVSTNASTITGGTLEGASGASGDLIVNEWDTSSNLTIGSVIANNGASNTAFTKSGPGSATLSGANTYTGGTYVNAGTLIVSGSLSGTPTLSVSSGATVTLQNGLIDTAGATTINAGGTLTGNGTVGGLAVSGTFAPGVVGSGGNGGVVAVSAASSFAAGAAFNLQISGTSVGQYGQLAAGGQTVSLSGSTQLSLTLATTYTPTIGNTFTLISDPGSAVAQNLYFGSQKLTQNSTFAFDNYNWEISYDGQIGTDTNNLNDVDLEVLSAVPEPGTWGTIVLGFGLLIGFQKNRKRQIGGRRFAQRATPLRTLGGDRMGTFLGNRNPA